MKSKGCLITLGVLGAIMVVGMIGLWLVFNKAKDIVGDIATGVGISPEIVERVEELNNKYPFEAPADNGIEEEQVQRFIAIKRSFADRIKQHEAELEELGERAGDEAGFKEVTEAYKILGDIRRDFLGALNKHEMSPQEYMYLTGLIYATYFTAAAHTGYQQAAEGIEQAREQYQEQLAELDKQLQDPKLTDEMKQAIQQSKKAYEKMMADMKTSAAQMQEQYAELPAPNIELLQKYRAELENLDTAGFEYWGLATMGYGVK